MYNIETQQTYMVSEVTGFGKGSILNCFCSGHIYAVGAPKIGNNNMTLLVHQY